MLAAVGATRRRVTAPAVGRDIDAATAGALDWDNAQTLVSVAQISGAVTLREQDDVIYDPSDSAAPFKLYFTAAFSATPDEDSRTYVITSTNGYTWSSPVACTVSGGGSLVGQDPSITQTLGAGPVAYRDGSDRLWMFLERNAPYSYTDVYSSSDGLVWTLEAQPAIPKGSGGSWDSDLTGSPVARYDGSEFIVGYEGIGGLNEASGLAIGANPTALVKHAANPVLTGPALGATGTTAFWDAFWLSADGERFMVTGHPGYASGLTMFRAYTTNLDPTTWTDEDFIYLGTVGPGREDLTCHLAANLYVTAPPDDLSLITVPFISTP